MNEEQLKSYIRKAKDGDQDAYSDLYNATSQEVYQTIRSMVRDEHLALDIQQEVYVNAFTHLDQLGDPAKFPAWLRAIAVNQTRSELRKKTPILFTELEREDGSDVPEVPDVRPENSPELQAEQKETSKLVQDILAELTDSQRLLVGMYYYEQIPVTRIAEDLGVSPGTVKTQLSRSRKKVETRVKALEEKGIKLYGLSPMPFLLALLKRLKPAEKAGKKVLAGALSESGVTAETVAVRATAGFFHTLAGKAVIAAAAVAAVVAGGVAGYRWYQNRGSAPNVGDVQLAESVYPSAWDDTPEDYVIETDPETDPEETDDVIVTVEDSPEDMPEEPAEPTDAESTDPTDPEPTDPDPTDPDPTVPATPPTQPDPPAPVQPTEPDLPAPAQPTDPEPEETEIPDPSAETTEPETPEESPTIPTPTQLPTEPPYPPKPDNPVISLGETWTYHYEGGSSVYLIFCVDIDLSSNYQYVQIGVQEDGVTDLSFQPDAAGTYIIKYTTGNGNELPWITITVKEDE